MLSLSAVAAQSKKAGCGWCLWFWEDIVGKCLFGIIPRERIAVLTKEQTFGKDIIKRFIISFLLWLKMSWAALPWWMDKRERHALHCLDGKCHQFKSQWNRDLREVLRARQKWRGKSASKTVSYSKKNVGDEKFNFAGNRNHAFTAFK